MKKEQEISQEKIEEYRLQIRELSNTAQYDKAHSLATALKNKYPRVLIFAYYEAVMSAEDDENFTAKQVSIRYSSAAKKLKKLLSRTRGAPAALVRSLRNEYYWFSRQPYKQYLLGVEEQKVGGKLAKYGGFYSQGVGAAMLAKKYAIAGKKGLALRWAQKSEQAWQQFFKIDSKWYNSYFFYAYSLGYQNRIAAAERAFAKACKIAKKPKNWSYVQKERTEMLKVRDMIWADSAPRAD